LLMRKFKLRSLVLLGTLALMLSLSPVISAHEESNVFKIENVKVENATTVRVIFNNPLADGFTDVCKRHFYGDHLDATTPHNHEVSKITLSDDKKTVTLTLARALHKDTRVTLAVLGVKDIYGNVLSSIDWRIWDTGSKN
jgi:hypothetical protein